MGKPKRAQLASMVTRKLHEEVIVNLKIANKHNNYKRDNYKHNNYKHGTGQDRCMTGQDRTTLYM